MVEEAMEDFTENLGGSHASDRVFEVGVDAIADVNQGLFHALDVERGVVRGGFFGQFVGELDDVGEQIPAGGRGRGGFLERGGNLPEKPGISDGSPTHHEAGGIGLPLVIEGGLGIDDVAVGNDRAGEGFHGQFHRIGADGGLISVRHRAAMDGQTVDRVLAEGLEQNGEFLMAVEAETGFDGETARNRVPQGPEDGIDLIRRAQQTAACVFPVNHRSRAAEIEVDSRDGILAQLPRRAGQLFNIAADHLCEDGPTRGIFGNRSEDVGIGS